MASTRPQFNCSRGCFALIEPTFNFGDGGLVAVPFAQAFW